MFHALNVVFHLCHFRLLSVEYFSPFTFRMLVVLSNYSVGYRPFHSPYTREGIKGMFVGSHFRHGHFPLMRSRECYINI